MSALRRGANVFEALVLATVGLTIVLLFTNAPTAPPRAPAGVAQAAGADGAAIYGDRCAGCHGGDGSGGIGPRLAGGRVLADFPAVEDQIAVVTDGRRGMPSFAGRLSEPQIKAVVEYTRTVLAATNP